MTPDFGRSLTYPHEIEWLGRYAAQMKTVVEIGSYKGETTYRFCTVCRGIVYAVDPFTGIGDGPVYEEFVKNCGHFANLRVFPMTSELAAQSPLIPKMVDMVFVDGDHEEGPATLDIKLWRPRCKKLLCGHDRTRSSVERALKASFPEGWEVGIGSIWVAKR